MSIYSVFNISTQPSIDPSSLWSTFWYLRHTFTLTIALCYSPSALFVSRDVIPSAIIRHKSTRHGALTSLECDLTEASLVWIARTVFACDYTSSAL